jgi:hypothetical protein
MIEIMRRALFLVLVASVGVQVSCSDDHMPTSASQSARSGAWGSDLASMTITGNSSNLQILASGGCYGSYGDIGRPIPAGAFSVAGIYTQLIGAYPGKIQYSAQFAGAVTGDQMTITVTVPGLQQSFGPFHLTYGLTSSWPACEYP